MKAKSISLCALLLTSMVFVALPEPATSHEEYPDNPIIPFADPPDFGSHGVNPETGWNDTTFSFWLNFSSDEEPINVSVQVYVDWTAYDMFENDTKDDNYSDGKDYYWMNEERLWSKGDISYFFYVEINETSNMTATNYFEIYNRAPYILSPPPFKMYVDEVVTYQMRIQDDDLDPIDGEVAGHNFTLGADWWWWEWWEENLTFMGKPKREWVRWINITIWDPYDQIAWYRWTIICIENPGGGSPPGDDPKTRGEAAPQITADSHLVLSPNGDGHELDWTSKGGGSHYVEVDDDPASPDDDTTYISVTSGNQEDYWSLEDPTTETGTISNVRLYLRVKHSAGGEEFAFALSNGSTEYVGTDVADSTSWTTYYEDHGTNPITSGDWYWGDIDYLQLGIKSRAIGGFTGTEYCTVGWIDITYSVVPNTDYFWCGSSCNAGANQHRWDNEDNWRDSATWLSNGYPNSNDDTASFNETSDSLYLIDGANSVITIGALTTTSGFTGTITFSVDLVIDDAGGKNGSLNHKAVATIDVNTSNEQINMDGNLYISSSATFTERSGTLIVQGAGTQEIRVQSTNKLYKLTTDTASTVGELYDNLTAFQITIGTGTTYKADAASRGYELWTNFTDAASCGFISTSAGTLQLTGTNAGPGANITTADAAPPPTNAWLGIANALSFTFDYATLTYVTTLQTAATWDIDNSRIENRGTSYAVNIRSGSTISSFTNTVIVAPDGGYGMRSYVDYTGFDGITSWTNTADAEIIAWTGANLEFDNSVFNATTSDVLTTTGASVISDNHNTVADAYKILMHSAHTLSKSTITNDFTTGDDIELVSGKFIMDEDGAMKQLKINAGTTWQVGKDTPDAAITLTFDDSASAGFHGSGDGTFITTGTATYGMTLKSVNNPPTTQWNLGTAGEAVTMDWTTVQDHNKAQGNDYWDVENTTFTHSGSDYVVHLQYLTNFANVTISTTTGHGMYMADEFVEYYNVVITSGAGKKDLQVEARLEFQYSNFDTSKVTFGGLIPAGGMGNYTSMNHNDVVTAYKIGTGTDDSPQALRKSAITHDFDSTFDVEIVQGSLGIDENADARGMFVSSGAYLSQSTGTTFDVSGNLTVNGTFLSDGTITDSGNYFDFWIGGGSVWLNNSTVSNAKLAYYYGGFNFTVGKDANSTINEWTLEAPSGIDTAFNITYYDFNNKGSGVIWHLNATASSGSVYFGTDNLTANERYDSYVDLVLYREHTADAGGWVNFSYNGWSTRHIYLTWVVGGPAPPEPPGPGQYDRWKVGFKYSKNFFTNEVRFQAVFRYDHNASWYIWDFDGVIYESASPNITRNFAFAFYSTENVKLTIIATDGNRYWMDSPITLDNSLWIALLCLTLISLGTVTILHTRRERRKTELIMVETEGR